MKPLMIIVSLVLLSSVERSAADVMYTERIDELVLEPLQENGMFWHVFSRTRVLVPAPELRLSTSVPKKDAEHRDFVPFRVKNGTAEDEGASVDLAGCYYPAMDVAYLWDDFTEAHVPVGQHPLITMKLPVVAKSDQGLCRAAPPKDK